MAPKARWPVARVVSVFGRIALTAISSAGATIAVLNFYLAPKKLPVIEGLIIEACNSVLDFPEPKEISKFLEGLEKNNKRQVFITEFGVKWYEFCDKDGRIQKRAKSTQLETVTKAKVNPRTGDIELEFRKLENFDGVVLKIHTPKEYPFAHSICGEACIGAEGVYQVKAEFAEAWGFFELTPALIIDRVANAHDCTLKTMEAETWWKRQWACY